MLDLDRELLLKRFAQDGDLVGGLDPSQYPDMSPAPAMVNDPAEVPLETDPLLQASRLQRDQDLADSFIAQGLTQIGSGLAGKQADTSAFAAARQAAQKRADESLTDVTTHRKSVSDAIRAARAEEKDQRDFDQRERQNQAIAGARQDTRQDKLAEKEEKKKEKFTEIESRRKTINDSLAQLQKMVSEDGTYELFGSHNKDMDRLIDGIATDMAKLQDPESVARPGEVELVRKNLVESGMFQRNSTAQNVLKNFENEVKKRADAAYSIRGLTPPGPKSLSPRDKEAAAWAAANPNDKRAKEINQRLGL
jgi:hypothetical protein